MALIGRPKLVILNNPLEGVDPHTKAQLIETILSYTEDRALLLSTQESEVAQRIANRVGVMHNGKMVAIGPVSKILEMHGQGFSIEVQANMSQLASQEP
jgi:ABC-type multidrug transport system ATPase subunit|mmetsp:Transcript_4590/g.6066  ORF Transcript_4590/g.6066 Transcript_4590/m.6066 type:complete len:99 (-) Transcript_4590:722-1018(-)